MAETDRLLRKSETAFASSGGNWLVRYLDAESRDGIQQNFYITEYPNVYYSNTVTNVTNFISPVSGHTKGSGYVIANYILGSNGQPYSPERYKFLKSLHYTSGYQMYYISAYDPPAKPVQYDACRNENGNSINYKFKAWIGWTYLYDVYGSISYTNPILNISSSSSLATIKNTLSNANPSALIQSYSFGHIYQRYSANGISGLTASNGTSISQYYHTVFQGYFVVNGGSKTIINSPYKGDGYTSITNYSQLMRWIIPGEKYNTSDPDSYRIYGYVATSEKLFDYSWLEFSNNDHDTYIQLTFLKDDTNFANGSTSGSGFLSGTQDKSDGLRYIYKFNQIFTWGYGDNTDEGLLINGVHNNILKVGIQSKVSCSRKPNGGTYRFHFKYQCQILNSSNTVLETIWIEHKNIYVGTSGTSISQYARSNIYSKTRDFKVKLLQIQYATTTSTVTSFPTNYSTKTYTLTKIASGQYANAVFYMINFDYPTLNNPH